MDSLLHKVADLSSHERSAIEAIIGHPLRDDQQLYIAALDAPVDPSASLRQPAWNELEEIIAEANDNVRDSGVSPEELERTIDQACDEVRYGS